MKLPPDLLLQYLPPAAIAVAPEMLEALELVRSEILHGFLLWNDEKEDPGEPYGVDKVRAAIAKAKGDSQ